METGGRRSGKKVSREKVSGTMPDVADAPVDVENTKSLLASWFMRLILHTSISALAGSVGDTTTLAVLAMP